MGNAESDEVRLGGAVSALHDAALTLRRVSIERGWSAAETHAAALDLERAMLLWRVRRAELLKLRRPASIRDLEAAVVALVEGT